MILIRRSTRIPYRAVAEEDWSPQDRAALDLVLRAAGRRMCRGCERILPRAAFNPGGRGQCPLCHRAAVMYWRASNPDRARANAMRRREALTARSVSGAPVTGRGLAAKFAYWSGICHICRTKVDPTAFQWDHVKPISKGGLHVLANLRPAHPHCNQVKNAKWSSRVFRSPCRVVLNRSSTP